MNNISLYMPMGQETMGDLYSENFQRCLLKFHTKS